MTDLSVLREERMRISYGDFIIREFDDGTIQMVIDPDDVDVPRMRINVRPEMQRLLREFLK